MKWKSDNGAMVAVEEELDQEVEDLSARAAEHYEFNDAEQQAHRRLQAAMASNPRLRKQVVKRIRRMQQSQGMSPTIKTRNGR